MFLPPGGAAVESETITALTLPCCRAPSGNLLCIKDELLIPGLARSTGKRDIPQSPDRVSPQSENHSAGSVSHAPRLFSLRSLLHSLADRQRDMDPRGTYCSYSGRAKFTRASGELNRYRNSWARRWQSPHSVIKFPSESSPEWMRNCLWWISRFDIVPQD